MPKKIRRYKRFSKLSIEKHKTHPNPQGMQALGYANHAERLRKGIDVIVPTPMQELQTAMMQMPDQPRLVTQTRLWQGVMRGQKVIAAYKIPIIKQQNRALHIHVSGNLYFFVEEEFFRGYYRKSIVYKTKERAMEVYKLDKISWIERGALPFPSDG